MPNPEDSLMRHSEELALLREIVDNASPCTSACSLLVDESLIDRAADLISRAEAQAQQENTDAR